MANGQEALAQALLQGRGRGGAPQPQPSGGRALAQTLAQGGGQAQQPSGLAQLFQDPGVQRALFQFGTNMMQPIQPGQTFAGQFGQSAQAGLQGLLQQRDREAAQAEAERERELQEQRLGLQERRVGYEGERLGLAREQAEQDRGLQERELDLREQNYESLRAYRDAQADALRRESEARGLSSEDASKNMADARILARIGVRSGDYEDMDTALAAEYQKIQQGFINPDQFLADQMEKVNEMAAIFGDEAAAAAMERVNAAYERLKAAQQSGPPAAGGRGAGEAAGGESETPEGAEAPGSPQESPQASLSPEALEQMQAGDTLNYQGQQLRFSSKLSDGGYAFIAPGNRIVVFEPAR